MTSAPVQQSPLPDELEALVTSFQSIFERLTTAAHNVENGGVVKIAQQSDVPRLRELSTPGSSRTVDEALHDAFEIFDFRARVNHPRFLAFVPGPAHPISWLGDCLTSAFNCHAGSKLQGSGCAVVEKTMVKWLATQAGLPDTAGGVFVSGGSIANMTALVLARDEHLPPGKFHLGVAYLSDQTHKSISKALRTLGFQPQQVRLVPTNGTFQMKPEELCRMIEADRRQGLIPFLVVGTSGTTNTGSVDPLETLADICNKEHLWFHIDGAYGASAVLSKYGRDAVQGLHRADSISWDAHKWLFQTYACSILLVRDSHTLGRSFGNEGDYLRDASEDDDIPNFWNYGIELTRPARAMKLWLTFRVLGTDGVRNMIDQGILQAEKAQEELVKLADWEITSPASLAILTFRFAPPGKTSQELDALNVAISQAMLVSDAAVILTTKLQGKVVLRVCSISPLLGVEGMASLVATINGHARGLL